jgi:hypothetical protein
MAMPSAFVTSAAEGEESIDQPTIWAGRNLMTQREFRGGHAWSRRYLGR